ncbi:pectate lyase [Rhizobium sp. XQZ8]|uniref:pectate lyase n=1 Tax=Rhizobium populisoli TaxID=2859785 RepID=UPI001CA5B95B|nr:pectate lyase [Rhizobium populisoli]MBW6426030.1 pectate lyase [Rhizobium populisoli]
MKVHIVVACAMAIWCAMLSSVLGDDADTNVTVSDCGAVQGSKIVYVDDLDPRSPTGLLVALEVKGPKIVIFRVGGSIFLDDDVEITTPFITIAGESAPDPGISLIGATLRVRTHDVCLSHLTIRTGPSSNPTLAENRDGIAIGGNPFKHGPIERVSLKNLTVEWGVDENLSVFHAGTKSVLIRSSLIANSLSRAGHPKGEHSKGMLIGSGVYDVTVSDNLFANNNDRNPRISPNTQVSLYRNAVVNPGFSSSEIFVNCTGNQPNFYIWRNIFIPGKDTRAGLQQYRFVDEATRQPVLKEDDCPGMHSVYRKDVVGDEAHAMLKSILASVGSRPARRDAYTALTIENVMTGSGRIISVPPSIDGETVQTGEAVFIEPENPFSKNRLGRMMIVEALCNAHLKLGGLKSADCV